ncbi:MAG: NlpC/P60 family protein [Coriobacteriia bacterium]
MRHLARSRVIMTVTACVLAGSMGTATVAAAPVTNASIGAKRAEASSVQATLERMGNELEIKAEEYDAITEALGQTRARIAETRVRLEAADRELASGEAQLDRRAADIYRGGGDLGFLDVLLGTTSFEDLLTRLEWLVRVNRGDADLVARVRVARAAVEEAELSLEARESEQVVLRAEAKVRRDRVEVVVRERQVYLDSLNADIARLVREEQERQRAAALERARLAAEAARRAREQAASHESQNDGVDPESYAGRSGIVDVALRFLDVPYQWGGTSPAGFDCSGLVQFVFAQCGIALPRASRSQYRCGTHIAADRVEDLRPGDLVFFGTDADPARVHHVGIYVGDGNYLHAPATGDRVRVSSLTERIAQRGDYVGASRF